MVATASLYNTNSQQDVDQPVGSTQTFVLDGNAEYTEYVITYTASDAASNENTCTWVLTIADNALPTLICPADQVTQVNFAIF